MSSVVGTKGQIVIEKAIRQALGIQAGYVAVQRLVGDHVEIFFFPPEHRRSLRGLLAPIIRGTAPQAEWDELRQRAWADAATAVPDEAER